MYVSVRSKLLHVTDAVPHVHFFDVLLSDAFVEQEDEPLFIDRDRGIA